MGNRNKKPILNDRIEQISFFLDQIVSLRRGSGNLKMSEHSTLLTSLDFYSDNNNSICACIICANVIQVHKEIKGSTSCIDHY